MEISIEELMNIIKERDFYKTKYEELLEEKKRELDNHIKELEEEISRRRMENLSRIWSLYYVEKIK